MSTVAQVATALASTIGTATGLRTYDYVPEDLTPPAVFVAFNRLEVVSFALGEVDMWFDCVVFTASASDRAGQKSMYAYTTVTGSKSIVKAVFDTPGLGLADANASAVSEPIRPLGYEEVAAYRYFGAVVPVRVVTDGA